MAKNKGIKIEFSDHLWTQETQYSQTAIYGKAPTPSLKRPWPLLGCRYTHFWGFYPLECKRRVECLVWLRVF